MMPTLASTLIVLLAVAALGQSNARVLFNTDLVWHKGTPDPRLPFELGGKLLLAPTGCNWHTRANTCQTAQASCTTIVMPGTCWTTTQTA
jgi:hypothetical protein